MGRPSSFSQETADAICQRISDGETLIAICKAEDMPGKSTVCRWLDENAAFQDQYARARTVQADHFAEEIVAIADEEPIVRVNGEEKDVSLDGGFVARQRLRVDARKWFASKVAPKKYGDKIDVEHSGRNGGPIQTLTAAMSPEEAAQAYRKAMEG
jgi:hypothetical protein